RVDSGKPPARNAEFAAGPRSRGADAARRIVMELMARPRDGSGREGRTPRLMRDGSRIRLALALGVLTLAGLPGSATTRCKAVDPVHRPCTDGYAYTADGWRLGIRRIRPIHPDPEKVPVVLCHGLGLNGTFWTITDGHLANQLAARGYEVFIPDMRGSG